jgi:hypothetical protein
MGVLLDVLVLGRDIRLGLVVVIIGNEVLHPVFREELFELIIELVGQGLVVGNYQGGLLAFLDDIGHGVGLSGSRDAYQGLKLLASFQAGNEFFDGFRLRAARFETGDKMELLQRDDLGMRYVFCHER